MAGEYTYTEHVPFQNVSSRTIGKGLKRFLIIAGIIVAAECIWLFIVSPCIPFSTLEINGFPGFDGTEVLRYAGIGEGASYLSVNAVNAERLLASHPAVESAEVVKRFPDRLSIFLAERQALALSLAEVHGELLPLYFDKQGVVFRIGNGAGAALADDLPLVSGLVFENPVPGMRLPALFGPFLAEFAKIAEGSPELMAVISEIRIDRKAFNGFDLVLFPVHYPIRVRLGDNFNEETLSYMLLTLDVLSLWDSVPEEIDFRSGLVAYKVEEAPSGK